MKPEKKIALIGSAPGSVMLAPYNSEDWEIWACSPGTFGQARNISKFFELHRWEPGQPWFSEGYVAFLENFPGEVIMSENVPSVRNCKVLDWKPLVAKYSEYFFTSSLAWMMAMAIEEGATSIGLWGVDMAAGEEYGHQRQGCQYFAMIARSMGIEVGVPPESDLFRPAPLYGLCEVSHGWIKQTTRTRELGERIAAAAAREREAHEELAFLQGAMDDMTWQQQNWKGSVHNMEDSYLEPPLVPALGNVVKGRGEIRVVDEEDERVA